MSSIAMIVAHVGLKETREMPLVQHDDLIEELAADAADDTLDIAHSIGLSGDAPILSPYA
jgi:hypothetical protein